MNRLLRPRPFQAVLRFTLICVFTVSAILGWTLVGWVPPAQSQLPSLPTATSNDPTQPPQQVTRSGDLEIAPVKSPLDGKQLFEVASPTIWNRDKVPEGKIPVEVRAQEITARLWRVVDRAFQAKTKPTVAVASTTLNNRPILQISDDQSSRPIRLITVTEPDADYHSKTLDQLAQEWQGIVQAEMVRLKQLSSVDVLRQRLGQSLQILLGLLVASFAIWFLQRLLTRRQKTLKARYQQELEVIAEAEKARKATDEIAQTDITAGKEAEAKQVADLRSQFLATMHHQFSLKRRLEYDKFLKWGLFWLLISIWYIGIYAILSRIPILMRWSSSFLTRPLLLILVWFSISLAIRISKSLIDRFMDTWKVRPYLPFGEAQRITLRSRTISGALKGLSTFVLVVIGILWTLGLFNIPTSSILAGGAVIGLAISFGSQSLIKDLVNWLSKFNQGFGQRLPNFD